jgi:hypothetical protein
MHCPLGWRDGKDDHDLGHRQSPLRNPDAGVGWSDFGDCVNRDPPYMGLAAGRSIPGYRRRWDSCRIAALCASVASYFGAHAGMAGNPRYFWLSENSLRWSDLANATSRSGFTPAATYT